MSNLCVWCNGEIESGNVHNGCWYEYEKYLQSQKGKRYEALKRENRKLKALLKKQKEAANEP